MKRMTFFIAMLLSIASTFFAQTYYYNVSKTFYEDGYTYQCDVRPSKLLELYNKENKLTYTEQVFKDTGKQLSWYYDPNDVQEETWTKAKSYQIVNAAFSPEEKERVKGQVINICMYIDSTTGKVTEVNFTLATKSPFATIPVSVYRQIEVELKKNIWFVPTEEGKKLNFLVRFWSQEIGETIPTE